MYSIDLRQRVVDAVNSNMEIDQAVEVFKVARRTIYDWIKLFKETGNLEPKTGYQKGHSHKIKDLEAFKIFVEENRGCSAQQMAEKWTELTGTITFHDTITRGLKKIDFTFKKKLLHTKKPILKNAQII
jgi:transposase